MEDLAHAHDGPELGNSAPRRQVDEMADTVKEGATPRSHGTIGSEGTPSASEADARPMPTRDWFWWACGTYLVLTALLVVATVALTGELWYSDDGFIHLAIARSFAEHGVWGVTADSFQSSSSAPLWTLILSGCVAVLGRGAVIMPLILNLACGVWLLWRLSSLRNRLTMPRWATGRAAAVGIVIVGFLPGLTVLGMEHMLQLAVCLEVLLALFNLVDRPDARYGTARLAMWAALCVATRFEDSVLVLGALAALLWCWRDRANRAALSAIAVLAAAAAPVVILAVIGVANDGFLLPNSILAKSAGIGVGLFGRFSIGPKRLLLNTMCDPLLTAGAVVLTWRWLRRLRLRRDSIGAGTLAVALAAWGQLVAGACLPAPRYQSWIVLLVVVMYTATMPSVLGDDPQAESSPRHRGLARLGFGVLILAVALSVLFRGAFTALMPHMLSVTHDQQGEVGHFVAENVPSDRVVILSDIGAPTWLRDGPILDLFALGSSDVLRAQLDGELNRDWLGERVAELKPTMAAANETLMDSLLPPGWTKVAVWTRTQQLLGSGSNRVAFYAPDSDAEALRRQLEAYEDQLPSLEDVTYEPH